MRARLLKDARIRHKAGEIVEVSPAEYNFLVSVGSAESVREPKEEGQKPARKRTTKK